ncbi:MAG: TolC family protein, partial [Leptospiraceae bacterium]|nr:TolC family protein [Leptospiraceae bacterium]
MQTTGVTLAEAESARIRLDLQTAIQVGAANDFALKSIRHEQATIRKLITERWRRYLPSVGVSVIRNRSINDSAPDSTAHEIRLTVEQVIYDGGQRGLDLDLARLDALLSRHDFYITYNELRLNVIEAYLAVLAARGKIILNRKSLERARLQLKHTLLEEKVGFTTRAQVYLVAARVREIELAMQTAHNDYTQAVHDLKQVLNLDFEVQLEVVGNLYADYYLLPPRADLNELVDRARSERPEARRSLALIHRLRKEKEMVESEWIPRISVSGYTNRTGDSYPLRERGWGANITITFPLGSHSGSSDAGVDYSRNNQDRASNAANSFDFYDDVSYERRLLERRIALGESISDYNRLHNSLAIEINRNYDQMRESWEAIRIGNG